jgi:hypothetical protein
LQIWSSGPKSICKNGVVVSGAAKQWEHGGNGVLVRRVVRQWLLGGYRVVVSRAVRQWALSHEDMAEIEQWVIGAARQWGPCSKSSRQ